MHRALLLGAAAVACLSLSACAGFQIPGSGAATNNAFHEFLTDPNCAHHDEATLVTGAAGMPGSFQAKLVRDCPARPTASTPAPAVTATPVNPPGGT